MSVHTATKWQNWDMNEMCVMPSVFLTVRRHCLPSDLTPDFVSLSLANLSLPRLSVFIKDLLRNTYCWAALCPSATIAWARQTNFSDQRL